MKTVTTIGLDITKSVFQVHGIDAEGKVAAHKQLKRVLVPPFLSKLEPASVRLKPVPRPTTGRESPGRKKFKG
jgi:transposase